MAFQFTAGRFKAFDDNGTPLAGGRLYTFASGTTNFKAAYTDATLGTACTYVNDGTGALYIALDARGEAQLWLGSGAYTFALKTSIGGSVWSVDGVEDTGRAYDTALRADLASTTGATKGVSLIGVFLASITGYIGRTLSLWLRDRPFHPRDFGAVGDGVADDTAAISAMFAAMVSARKTGSVGTSVLAGMMPRADFGDYKYKVSATTSPPNYCRITGSRAQILPTTNAFDIFSNVGYMTDIEGLAFMGGQRAISIATANVDTTVINIRNNEFHEQLLAAVECDGNSASTRLNIEECKVYNTKSGATIYKIVSGDLCTIRGGWASVAGVFVQSGDATHQSEVIVDGVCGVPLLGSTVWGVNYSSLTFLPGTRFGGESGATLVKNYAKIDASSPNILAITECQAYCAGKFAVEFYGIPNIFLYRNNRGQVNSKGFYFDASIPNLLDLRSYLAGWLVEGNVREERAIQGLISASARVTVLQAQTNVGTSSLLVSDKVAQARATTAVGGSIVAVTASNQVGMFGQPTRRYVGNNATYDGTISETWNNQLTGLATGIYTVVYEINNQTAHPVTCSLYGADLDAVVTVRQGKHLVSVPFYWDSATSTNRVGWSFNSLNNAQQVELGNIRVFKGDTVISNVNNVLYADAAPATLQWEVGDIVEKLTPTVGQFKRQRCTVAGVPGTWVSEGNL